MDYVYRLFRLPVDEHFTAKFYDTLATLAWPDMWLDRGVEPYQMVHYVLDAILGVKMIGSIHAVATDVPDWGLLCDGTQYARADYPELYAVLNSAYIVDADNFTVPDLRGRAIIGAGTGSGLTSRTIGDDVGTETHQLTESEMPAHTHSYNYPTLNVDLEAPGAPDITALGQPPISQSTGSTGGDNPHNNMQPSHVLTYYIWAK